MLGVMFDRCVAVDWSAAATPRTGANSIWIADADPGGDALDNPSTRLVAEQRLRRIITEARASGERLLIGIDVSLGYPRGTATALQLSGDQPWRAMWDAVCSELVDDDRNHNNRFEVAAALNARLPGEGPFWGAPSELPHLRRTKPETSPLPEFRVCEERLRARGRSPKSVWQLLGVGSVGSQTLTVIPMLRRLIDDLGAGVWPLTTGAVRPDDTPIVIAEVWPAMFDVEVREGEVLDAAQVRTVARALLAVDESSFGPELTADERRLVEREEGWVLGA